ncbi:MAG: hypothetical protein HDQ88_07580 [Clostridia bacterium]|nr:hypothetical protein [Clostridia bacterium]
MKKKFLAILATAVLIIASFSGAVAFADVSLEECDKCFQTTVNSLLNDEDVGSNTITALRKPVYDLNLSHLGYVYEFEIYDGAGYAIIICDNGEYIAQELVTSSQSPYIAVEDALCVYANTMSYFKSVDGQILDIESEKVIPDDFLSALKETAIFYQTDDYTTNVEYETVKIYYTSRNYDNKALCQRHPQFHNPSGLVGACASIAGGNLIGYFDRFYEDLIPNHEAGYTKYGKYYYNYQDTYVGDTIKELYSDMNGTSAGISETNFINGLKKYCSRKSLTCDFTSIMSGSTLSFNKVKEVTDEGKPIALLLNTYTTCDVAGYEDFDAIHYSKYSGNHVMVGFGYGELTYTLSNGSTQNYQFVGVATGFANPTEAFFNINYNTNIVSAYKVNIH